MENSNIRCIPKYGSINPNDWVGGEWNYSRNCWDFVRTVYDNAGIELPQVQVDVDNIANVVRMILSEQQSKWVKADAGLYGSVVTMTHSKFPSHVGIQIQDGWVLHSLKDRGVIVSKAKHLELLGLKIIGYWRLNEHGYHSGGKQPA